MFLGTACLPKSRTTQNQRKVGQNFKSATEIAAYFHFFIRFCCSRPENCLQTTKYFLSFNYLEEFAQTTYIYIYGKEADRKKGLFNRSYIVKVVQACNFSFSHENSVNKLLSESHYLHWTW